MNKLFVQLLSSENIASRSKIYNKYDKNVQGNSIIEAGEADAGVMAPLLDMEGVSPEIQNIGIAVKQDGLSRYSQISAYWQAADSVVESMRNVAAVGATPVALTDCLNYNNPEKPEEMWEFEQGVKGITDACKGIPLKGTDTPVPIISGNVSLYNSSIDVTAMIGCSGVMKDYHKAVNMQLKQAGNKLYLLGERKDELGAGEFYRMLGHLGANVPKADFAQAKAEIYTVIDGIDAGVIKAAHDISEGGLLVTLAEMTMPNPHTGGGKLGVRADIAKAGLASMPAFKKAFSETGGFVVEISDEKGFKKICDKYKITPILLGEVTPDPAFEILHNGKPLVIQFLDNISEAWMGSLAKKLK